MKSLKPETRSYGRCGGSLTMTRWPIRSTPSLWSEMTWWWLLCWNRENKREISIYLQDNGEATRGNILTKLLCTSLITLWIWMKLLTLHGFLWSTPDCFYILQIIFILVCLSEPKGKPIPDCITKAVFLLTRHLNSVVLGCQVFCEPEVINLSSPGGLHVCAITLIS